MFRTEAAKSPRVGLGEAAGVVISELAEFPELAPLVEQFLQRWDRNRYTVFEGHGPSHFEKTCTVLRLARVLRNAAHISSLRTSPGCIKMSFRRFRRSVGHLQYRRGSLDDRALVHLVYCGYFFPGIPTQTPRGPSGSSRPGDFHPEPLTEPCVSLSTHTARATPVKATAFRRNQPVPPVAS